MIDIFIELSRYDPGTKNSIIVNDEFLQQLFDPQGITKKCA
jgi:hypothetical protein